MTLYRTFLSFALAALIALSAVGMGIARGQAPVAGHVTLCGSFGVHTVAVDADGNVLAAPGHCPDCAGMLLALSPTAPEVSRGALDVALSDFVLPGQAYGVRVAPTGVPPVRGPPLG